MAYTRNDQNEASVHEPPGALLGAESSNAETSFFYKNKAVGLSEESLAFYFVNARRVSA